MAEKIYANGIFFNPKHEKQPDFVLGSLSIVKDKFAEWLATQETDSRGYVRLQILNGREGKPYLTVDTYKATQKQGVQNLAPEEDDSIPF
jgi:hypothetical protein